MGILTSSYDQVSGSDITLGYTSGIDANVREPDWNKKDAKPEESIKCKKRVNSKESA
jgi:hypothetical protein